MEYDIVIAGAGPAGFGAAMGAARLGKKVLVFDRNSGPGGVAVYCGCPVFSGLRSFLPENSGGAAGEFAHSMKNNAMIWRDTKLNSSVLKARRCAVVAIRDYHLILDKQCTNLTTHAV